MTGRPQDQSPGAHSPQQIRLWIQRLATLLPACAVLALAFPRLLSGFALEATYPAPTKINMNVALSQTSNRSVSQLLSHASLSDGETQILRAEAGANAGLPPATIIPIVRSALIREPGVARGWVLLAALLRHQDPKKAATAFSLAVEIAPREYYLVTPSAFVGASLWNYLPKDDQTKIIDDAHLLATTPELREGLHSLIAAPSGPELIKRALADHPEELRELNRSLARESASPKT